MSIEVYNRFNENSEESIIIADAYLDEPEAEENLFERTVGSVVIDEKNTPFSRKKKNDKPGIKWVIEVRDNDGGNDPHFHIWKGWTGKGNKHQQEVCIKILEPEYFPHKQYKDKLNRNQINNLDSRLNDKINVNGKVMTLWELICDAWNKNYYQKSQIIKPDAVKPDYTKLEEK